MTAFIFLFPIPGPFFVDLDDRASYMWCLSLVFSRLIEDRVTIFYFAKEGDNCRFFPLYPDLYIPWRIQFQKDLGQTFCQPSWIGIDLGFLELDVFSYWSSEEDILPLVIHVETCSPPPTEDVDFIEPVPNIDPHAQITQAVVENNSQGLLHVKVVKQIWWIDGVHYELSELYESDV